MRFQPFLLPILLGSAPVLLAQAKPSQMVNLLTPRVAPGGLAVLRANGVMGTPRPRWARLGEGRHAFFPLPPGSGAGLAALVPVPFGTDPGTLELRIEGEDGAVLQRVSLTVVRGSYPVLTVAVPQRHVELSPEDKARAAREREEIKAIQASPALERLWTEGFRDPVPGIVTCVFGTTRKFNGTTPSVHKGLDLRAPAGTPVRAPAAGTVRLAKDLFFGGNLVLVDHGCGLFTSYAHLSAFDVAPGQPVKPGQLLGRSGATGRVSAAHLHWGASIDGVEVDARELKRWTAVLAEGRGSARKR